MEGRGWGGGGRVCMTNNGTLDDNWNYWEMNTEYLIRACDHKRKPSSMNLHRSGKWGNRNLLRSFRSNNIRNTEEAV